MKLYIGIWCLFLLVHSVPGHAQAADEHNQLLTAQHQVERLHDTLIRVMQLQDQSAREAALEPVITEVFDVKNIARISVGRTWRTITQDQQHKLVTDLRTLIVATYADRFDSYNQQKFQTEEVLSVKTGPVIKTRLVRVDDEPVSLDYYLRSDGVFNVVADGVSDLSLRRADYNSIIKQQGFDALMQYIAEKIDEARNAPAS